VNCQGATRDELISNLREALSEAIELNREDAKSAAGESFEEIAILPWNAAIWFDTSSTMGANSYVREATIPGGETLKTEAAPLCRAIMKYLTTLPAKFVVTWVFPSRDHVEAETKTSTNQAL
jgi:hypothetical protein